MRLHKPSVLRRRLRGEQYVPYGHKKCLRRQNAPKAQRQAKKERDIRPRYCTAPSRVFSNK